MFGERRRRKGSGGAQLPGFGECVCGFFFSSIEFGKCIENKTKIGKQKKGNCVGILTNLILTLFNAQ